MEGVFDPTEEQRDMLRERKRKEKKYYERLAKRCQKIIEELETEVSL